MNGTCLASTGPVTRICAVLGFEVKLYDEENSREFIELIKAAKPPVKKPIPEGSEVLKYMV